MNLEPDDDYREEDEERDEFGSRSIFAAGWFRAALVLTILAIVVVISLPYLLNWLEPASAPKTAKPDVAKQAAPPATARASDAATAPASAPPASAPPASAPEPPRRTPPASSQARPAAPAVAASPQVRPAPEPPSAAASSARNRSDRPATVAKAEERPSPPPRPAKPDSLASADRSERYWVQLGAFRDAVNAEALARTVRSEGFAVQVSQVTRGNPGAQARPQRHELFVTQARAEKVGAALKGRGRAEAAPGGVIVRPALSLDDAMSVSRQLTADGFNVVIRPADTEADSTVHVVRAGGYSDRARALAARDALKAKGHEGFVAEGTAR